MKQETIHLLESLAAQYENADFLNGDPSWFMHQTPTEGDAELMAFVASCFSYGQRPMFMKKLNYISQQSDNKIVDWVISGSYRDIIPNNKECFYRFSTNSDVVRFFSALRNLLLQYGSIKDMVRTNASDALSAIKAITSYFADAGLSPLIPSNAHSACKRLAMFLRWMVRDKSPVDLGLWHDIIQKQTLIMPMDTHVVHEALRLELIKSHAVSMTTALQLTEQMRIAFPDDPLKGDFALFGLGITK